MVLYRKYRPQTLNEIVGQTLVKQSLLAAFKANKLSHAYLFYGPRGTGKTSTARILAKMVNCLDLKDVPCNKCEICQSIQDGTSLDLIEIDAASNRGIDDIRSLRETIKLAPAKARQKVYIFDEVHMLTQEAFNALLKTLEEPPSHALFILATTEIGKVPQTILSRVTQLGFKLATTDELEETLKRVAKNEQIKLDGHLLQILSQKAQGSFRDGIKLLDQISTLQKLTEGEVEENLGGAEFHEVVRMLQLIFKGEARDSLKAVTKQLEKGTSVKELNLTILELLRGLLLIKNGLIDLVKEQLGEEKFTTLNQLAKSQNQDEIVKSIELFQKSLEQARFVLPPSLPLELAMVESCRLEVKSQKVKTAEEAGVDQSQPAPVSNTPDIERINDRWGYILETIKPHNYSLEALLRSAKIVECTQKLVVIEVPYSFHQRILESPKSKDLLESVLSDVLARSIGIQVKLGQKPQKMEDIANIEVAADDEIIRAALEIFDSDTVN